MIQKIFTVYDEKAHAYLPPFFMARNEQALRVFGDCLNSADHQFAKHPADYTLFEIGNFDDNSAEIIPSRAIPMGNGLEFLSQPTAPDLFDDKISNDTQLRDDTPSGNSA